MVDLGESPLIDILLSEEVLVASLSSVMKSWSPIVEEADRGLCTVGVRVFLLAGIVSWLNNDTGLQINTKNIF